MSITSLDIVDRALLAGERPPGEPVGRRCVSRAHAWLRRGRTTYTGAAVGIVLLTAGYSQIGRVTPLLHGISFQPIHALIAQWGPWAPVVSLLIMVCNTFLPIPGESLGIVNGAIFGFWGGLALSWIGAMSSAALAFGIGRALRRRSLTRGPAHSLLTHADALLQRGWRVALVIRFIPMFPFGLFNFALGRAPVRWGTFLWTTALGVLPITASLVAVGYGAAAAPSTISWVMLLLATIFIAGLVCVPSEYHRGVR